MPQNYYAPGEYAQEVRTREDAANRRLATFRPNPVTARNPARVGVLAKFLGLDPEHFSQQELEDTYREVDAERQADEARAAEAKLAPERIRGDFSLATERLRGDTARDVARYGRDAARIDRESQREFTAEQNRLAREAVAARVQQSSKETTERTGMIQQGLRERQQRGQLETRARALEAGKQEPTYPPTNGVMDSLKYYLGIGKFDRQTAAAAQAQQLRAQAVAPGGGNGETSDVQAIAQQYQAQYGHLSDDDLIDVITQNEPDASPEDLDALFGALDQLRSR